MGRKWKVGLKRPLDFGSALAGSAAGCLRDRQRQQPPPADQAASSEKRAG